MIAQAKLAANSAAPRQVFDSAKFERNFRFGNSVFAGHSRAYQPTPQEEREYIEMMYPSRFVATRVDHDASESGLYPEAFDHAFA